ncbi:hypothetical protein MMC11_008820 [Xylographa trunciseda]|nr:hypothetical protein [Xylographa trunciseda]
MPSFYPPTVLTSVSLLSFLDMLLQSHASPSTLVICCTREDFLQTLLSTCRSSEKDISLTSEHADTYAFTKSLFTPTIHLLATSRTINLAFTPTLTSLRAYLATYEPPLDPTGPSVTYDKPGKRTPILGILNILEVHRGTSDFSAQGISRTFASAIAAAVRSNMQLLVNELPGSEGGDEEREFQIQYSEGKPWTEQVPLLCGSLRFGDDQKIWAGRTVEIRQVVARWCRFRTLDQFKEMD